MSEAPAETTAAPLLPPLTATDSDPFTSTALKDGAAWELRAVETAKGRGVVAGRAIPKGALVLRFEGPVFDKYSCPEFSEALQVGVDAWMWSSGGLDDLVNHSCEPNLGLWQLPAVGGHTYLLAVKDVAAGEELSFDYSTSMVDEPWDMEGCLCRAAKCRGLVGNFLDMPEESQRFYARLGVLPHHVWVTAHARGVELENCPVRAGICAPVPEQSVKKDTTKASLEERKAAGEKAAAAAAATATGSSVGGAAAQ